jgi:hypothetical protein
MIAGRLSLPLSPSAPANIRKSTAGTGNHIWRANTAMRMAGYVRRGIWLLDMFFQAT